MTVEEEGVWESFCFTTLLLLVNPALSQAYNDKRKAAKLNVHP